MRKRRDSRPVDGVLMLDKPAGWTSNFALQRIKRLYQAERAGHTGTLDPMATGLLPICFGEATKYGTALLESDKSYLATLKLGERTDTGDAEGKVIQSRAVEVSIEMVAKAVAAFRGSISQIPPMHSALKREGRPLYELARQGKTVERNARIVIIKCLEVIELNSPILVLQVLCSKGTYIRVLAEDLGEHLGCGAHLIGLRRTGVGGFDMSQSHTLAAIEALDDAGRLALLLPVDAMLESLPVIRLAPAAAARFMHGMAVQVPESDAKSGKCRVYSPDRSFMGVGSLDGAGWLKAERLLKSLDPLLKSAPESLQST